MRYGVTCLTNFPDEIQVGRRGREERGEGERGRGREWMVDKFFNLY